MSAYTYIEDKLFIFIFCWQIPHVYDLWNINKWNEMKQSVPWKSIDIGRHGTPFGDTDDFDSSASISARTSVKCVTGSHEFINILTTFFNVYTEHWTSLNSYTSHDLKYIIIHVHNWIRMRVLWFLRTSAHIFFCHYLIAFTVICCSMLYFCAQDSFVLCYM